jgi:HPt (histidine-containing phosphotransfer) domain-containing protein
MKQDIIDLTYLKAIAGDDEVFINEMLNMFLTTTPPELINIEQFYQAGDYHMMGSAAHKIKAPIQMLGDETTTNLLIEIEHIAKSGQNREKLPDVIGQVKNRLTALLSEVQNLLNVA